MAEKLTQVEFQTAAYKNFKKPIRVVVTGAAGNIGYTLVFMICQGRMLGWDQPIDLVLTELPQQEKALNGVLMEIEDGAFPLVHSVIGSVTEDGFKDVQLAILVGAKPRSKGMERIELLGQNAKIFRDVGRALNKYADLNVKVCVVGNPANTNAYICSHFADKIPKSNFTALTRLDQNRAVHQIGKVCKTQAYNIKNITIWGNHSLTQYPDINHGFIENYPNENFKTSIMGALQLQPNSYIKDDFIPTVAKRGAAIIEKRGASSAASAASATCDHVRDWFNGTNAGCWTSMAVISDGSYNIPEGICFSFPLTCHNAQWKIVQNLILSDFSKERIQITLNELLEERQQALDYLEQNP